MEILIDKRIELITILQTLCNYWDNLSVKYYNMNLFKCKYKEEIKKYFEKYKNHEMIQLYHHLSSDITDISAFLNLALCYSYPSDLISIANYEDNFDKISESAFPYKDFISGLRKFYTDTDFERFFRDNQKEYGNILNDYVNKYETENTIYPITNYLENEIKNYKIIISVLIFGSFGIKINTVENKTEHYTVLSPFDYKDNIYLVLKIQ